MEKKGSPPPQRPDKVQKDIWYPGLRQLCVEIKKVVAESPEINTLCNAIAKGVARTLRAKVATTVALLYHNNDEELDEEMNREEMEVNSIDRQEMVLMEGGGGGIGNAPMENENKTSTKEATVAETADDCGGWSGDFAGACDGVNCEVCKINKKEEQHQLVWLRENNSSRSSNDDNGGEEDKDSSSRSGNEEDKDSSSRSDNEEDKDSSSSSSSSSSSGRTPPLSTTQNPLPIPRPRSCTPPISGAGGSTTTIARRFSKMAAAALYPRGDPPGAWSTRGSARGKCRGRARGRGGPLPPDAQRRGGRARGGRGGRGAGGRRGGRGYNGPTKEYIFKCGRGRPAKLVRFHDDHARPAKLVGRPVGRPRGARWF